MRKRQEKRKIISGILVACILLGQFFLPEYAAMAAPANSDLEQSSQQDQAEYIAILINDIKVSGIDATVAIKTMNAEDDWEDTIFTNYLTEISLHQKKTPITVTRMFLTGGDLSCRWTSENDAVASVKDGYLCAGEEGRTRISLETGQTRLSFQITVEVNRISELEEYINGMYQEMAGKVPTYNEIYTWENRCLSQLWTKSQLLHQFMMSEEVQKYAASTEEYMKLLIVHTDISQDDAAVYDKWLACLDYKSREELFLDFEAEYPISIPDIELEIVPSQVAGSLNISSGYIWPLPGHTSIASGFGERICPFHGLEMHNAIDIPAPAGTPIVATAAGTVIVSEFQQECGNYIIIDHGKGYWSVYMHCQELYVPVGTRVSQGQTIAAVGQTGNATGAHLDFRIKHNGVYENPLNYVSKS